jgi:hypothetical protein|tara:strand:- start:1637 stop:2065 length:429 start_codon:yes stop_codon:yes gene_type:complete
MAAGLRKGLRNSLDGVVGGVLLFGMVPAGIYYFCSPGKDDAAVSKDLEKRYGVKEQRRSASGSAPSGRGLGVGSDDADNRRAGFASIIQQTWAEEKNVDPALRARMDRLLSAGGKANAPPPQKLEGRSSSYSSSESSSSSTK